MLNADKARCVKIMPDLKAGKKVDHPARPLMGIECRSDQ